MSGASTLVYQGAACLRQRVVFAALSGRRLRIENVRHEDESPGVSDAEVTFLKLISDLSHGAVVDINETGTTVKFTPGVLAGGHVSVDCGVERGVGYFIEGVLPLLPFTKTAVSGTFTGVTDCAHDPSADCLREILLPALAPFGLGDAELKIKSRGALPLGGGTVTLIMPTVRELKPVDIAEAGFIKRVRGVAFCTKTSPQMANRMVDGARGLLNKFLPDVYIHTDPYKGVASGNSPGYGITLVAESTSGVKLSTQVIAPPATLPGSTPAAAAAAASGPSADAPSTPEDVGVLASQLLCEVIAGGGCVDTTAAPLVLTAMALCPEDVSRVRLPAHMSHYTVETLRLLKEFFGVVFKLKVDEASGGTVVASCLGVGFKNYSKKVT